jgi:hypothetical protein
MTTVGAQSGRSYADSIQRRARPSRHVPLRCRSRSNLGDAHLLEQCQIIFDMPVVDDAAVLGPLLVMPTPSCASPLPHSALRNGTRSVRQELFGTPALHELIDVMRVTLGGNGVIAVPLRLFVIEDTQDRMGHLTPKQQKARNRYPFPFEAVINPIWYATSPEMVIETEGCLSIPGFKADVCRY